MAKPDIVFVPGFWEGSSAFDHCARLLREADYTVHTASLLSTGVPFTEHPKSPSLHDDVNHIRSLLENLIRLDRELVLVLHSAGGFLGSHAIEGLSATIRAKNAQKGGVVHLAFVAGGVCPEGTVHQDLPFFEVEGGKMWCKSPRTLLFNDVTSDVEAEQHTSKLLPQPSKGWNGTITYGGWKEVSSSYLVCENDAILPPPLQRQFADLAKSKRIESCDAGHMAPITASKMVSDFVRRAAGEHV